jgi:(2Fe-2S) ferredoxin
MERRTERMRGRGLTATVFVCTNERTEHAACAAVDGAGVADAVRDWLRDRDRYWSEVAVAETSCLGMCGEQGAAVVVQPHDEWFSAVEVDDVPTLMAETVGVADGDDATEPTATEPTTTG